MGPCRQIKTMFSPPRLASSLVYIGAMIGTLYAALWVIYPHRSLNTDTIIVTELDIGILYVHDTDDRYSLVRLLFLAPYRTEISNPSD